MDEQAKPKLLLQVCCAPDATVVVERLREEYDIGVYFYNPNIHPESEYRKRAEEMENLAPQLSVRCFIGQYESELWFGLTKGLGREPEKGRRCKVCIYMRLLRTAQLAKKHGYDFFATVLTVSPHKDAELINWLGRKVADHVGVKYIESNFKKKDGFKRSIELSRQFGLYRQDYCGCKYSKRDRERQKREQELAQKSNRELK